MEPAPEGGLRLQALVVYALPDRQWALPVTVAAGARIRDAIAQSGIAVACPELPGGAEGPWDVGVFNRAAMPDDLVRDGDRIEIYRSLQIDPKEARRLRAGARR